MIVKPIKSILRTLLVAVTLLASSCAKDSLPWNAPSTDDGVTISYTIEGLVTRANVAARPDECAVSEACLIFYKAADDTYVSHTVAEVLTSGSASGSFNINLPAGIIEGVDYKVLVVANYKFFVADAMATTDKYVRGLTTKKYDEMKAAMKSQLDTKSTRVTTPLPMYGESTLKGPAAGAQEVGLSVLLRRSVARFDLTCRSTELDIKWVKVCNYRTQGYMFHNDVVSGQLVTGTAMDTATSDAGVVVPSGAAGAQSTDGGLYAFSNTVAYPQQNDGLTTCLMIAGVYKGTNVNNTKVTYYRLNIAGVNASQVLKLNNVYRITINNVTSAGSTDEQQAMTNASSSLGFQINDWQTDDNTSIVTDDNGNFVSVSRTSVILDSSKGAIENIKVSVKAGTAWGVRWVTSPQTAFGATVIDPTSFAISTLADNTANLTNNAKLEVYIKDITPTLAIPIDVMQMSTINEVPMLTVNGSAGNISVTVPGQGTTLNYQVLTGAATASWATAADNTLAGFATSTATGGHKGYLVVAIQPNLTGKVRTGKLTVTRNPTAGIAPVTIQFTQPVSPYTIAVYPDVVGTQGVIEGFKAEKVFYHRAIHYQERHIVTLVDSNPQAKWIVVMPQNHMEDYRISGLMGVMGVGSTVQGRNSDSFYIQVFNTGPGDEDIHSQIQIGMALLNASGQATGAIDRTKQVITIPITITTSCVIGYVQVKGTTFFDRDSGAPTPAVAPKPLCFIYHSSNPINPSWRGDDWSLYTLSQGIVIGTTRVRPCDAQYTDDTDNWCVPALEDITNMMNVLSCSKGRPYILSEQKNAAGKYVGSFLSYQHDWNSTHGFRYIIGGYYKSTYTDTLQIFYDDQNNFKSQIVVDGPRLGRVRCVKKLK